MRGAPVLLVALLLMLPHGAAQTTLEATDPSGDLQVKAEGQDLAPWPGDRLADVDVTGLSVEASEAGLRVALSVRDVSDGPHVVVAEWVVHHVHFAHEGTQFRITMELARPVVAAATGTQPWAGLYRASPDGWREIGELDLIVADDTLAVQVPKARLEAVAGPLDGRSLTGWHVDSWTNLERAWLLFDAVTAFLVGRDGPRADVVDRLPDTGLVPGEVRFPGEAPPEPEPREGSDGSRIDDEGPRRPEPRTAPSQEAPVDDLQGPVEEGQETPTVPVPMALFLLLALAVQRRRARAASVRI
ncbi:MAG: hypothetical protein ACPGQL_09175 [Thermoplasmatota archaeon]